MSRESFELCGPRIRSSSSEDDVNNVGKRKRRPPKKRHIKEQKFVIHPRNLNVTLMELHRARKTCTTLPLDDGKSEAEIRAALEERLPQLREIRCIV